MLQRWALLLFKLEAPALANGNENFENEARKDNKNETNVP